MKKLSKATALLLVLVMMFALLAGCGQENQPTTQPSTQPSAAPSDNSGTEQNAEPSNAPTQEAMTLQWGFTPPANSVDEVWHRHVGDLVTEKTNGAITFEYYPGGALGNEKVALEGVASGTINMHSISPNVIATAVPELNAVCLPFLFDSMEHYFAVISSDEYYEKMNEVCNKIGVQYIGPEYAVPRTLATNSPVRTPDEANGQVLRVMDGQIYTDMMALWGFGSSVISYGEVYTALQQGVVDGVENTNEGNYTMKFNEVYDYTTNTNHVYHAQHTLMNLDLWNSLTPETQQAFRDAMKETYAVIYDEIKDYPAEYTKLVEESGVEMIDLTDEELQAWKDASAPLYDKYRSIIGEEFYDWFMNLVDAKRPA